VKAFDVVTEREAVLVAHTADLCIAVPRGVADESMVQDLHRGMKLMAARRDRGFALLFIVTANSTAPSGPAKAAAGAMFDDLRGSIKACAAIIAGTGFATAVKRSVFTWATGGMLGKVPLKTFPDVGSATGWLGEQVRDARLSLPSADDLVAFLREHGGWT
jgi:hypothetical protein